MGSFAFAQDDRAGLYAAKLRRDTTLADCEQPLFANNLCVQKAAVDGKTLFAENGCLRENSVLGWRSVFNAAIGALFYFGL